MDMIFEPFQSFVMAMLSLASPTIIITSFLSVSIGVLVGALPGLTATLAVSLLVGLTFGLDAILAMTILLGVYVGGVYGGSQTAILLNIPGTPASAATAIEGYPLAMRGMAGEAIGLATVASFVGTLIGALMLLLLSPALSSFALKFGAWEYFLLALFGVLLCGTLAGGEPLKGWIAGLLGLLLAMVGVDELHAYERFTFGNLEFHGGLSLIPAMIGLFAIPEILSSFVGKDRMKESQSVGRILPSLGQYFRYMPTTVRSGFIGTLVGVIPGTGADVAAWVSYAVAKRFSRRADEYGNGSREGLVAAEVANSTAVGGTLVPLLTLAIPGGAVSAVILGALWIHDIRPGPLMFMEHPGFFYQITALFVISAFFLLFTGLTAARVLPYVLKIPNGILMPIVAMLCVVGTYAVNMRVFDLYLMLGFGFFGYILRHCGYSPAPLVLGLILGTLADTNLRRALYLSDGSLSPFVTRPVSATLVALLFLILSLSLWTTLRDARARRVS